VSEQNPGSPGGGLMDRVKGTMKQVAGTVLGDDDLKREGELHHDKVEKANEAKDAAAKAAQEQTEADLVTREREIEIERQRIAAETAADARADQIERERAVEEQRIAAQTAQQEAAVERSKEAQQAAASQQVRDAAKQRLDAERRAADLEAEAKRSEQAAAVLDNATEEIA
jgi:uncharacterized protein YjbJ (UPF0337 family)